MRRKSSRRLPPFLKIPTEDILTVLDSEAQKARFSDALDAFTKSVITAFPSAGVKESTTIPVTIPTDQESHPLFLKAQSLLDSSMAIIQGYNNLQQLIKLEQDKTQMTKEWLDDEQNMERIIVQGKVVAERKVKRAMEEQKAQGEEELKEYMWGEFSREDGTTMETEWTGAMKREEKRVMKGLKKLVRVLPKTA